MHTFENTSTAVSLLYIYISIWISTNHPVIRSFVRSKLEHFKCWFLFSIYCSKKKMLMHSTISTLMIFQISEHDIMKRTSNSICYINPCRWTSKSLAGWCFLLLFLQTYITFGFSTVYLRPSINFMGQQMSIMYGRGCAAKMVVRFFKQMKLDSIVQKLSLTLWCGRFVQNTCTHTIISVVHIFC